MAVVQALAENLENKITQVSPFPACLRQILRILFLILFPDLPLPHVPCHFSQSHTRAFAGVVQPAQKLRGSFRLGIRVPGGQIPREEGPRVLKGLKRTLRIRCFFRSNLSDFTGDLQGLSVSTKHHLNRAQG